MQPGKWSGSGEGLWETLRQRLNRPKSFKTAPAELLYRRVHGAELLAKQTCIGNVAMTTTVIRCPDCVLDDEFREMIARPDGRFVCPVRPLASPG